MKTCARVVLGGAGCWVRASCWANSAARSRNCELAASGRHQGSSSYPMHPELPPCNPKAPLCHSGAPLPPGSLHSSPPLASDAAIVVSSVVARLLRQEEERWEADAAAEAAGLGLPAVRVKPALSSIRTRSSNRKHFSLLQWAQGGQRRQGVCGGGEGRPGKTGR